jgi:hypothetical protein
MDSGKIGFTSLKVFLGLGYALKNVVKGDTSSYPMASVLSSPSQAHPVGSWILSKKTVYYVTSQGLVPVTSWDIFLRNGGLTKYLVKANKADLTLPLLQNMS